MSIYIFLFDCEVEGEIDSIIHLEKQMHEEKAKDILKRKITLVYQ
jgi:hypothetical protein